MAMAASLPDGSIMPYSRSSSETSSPGTSPMIVLSHMTRLSTSVVTRSAGWPSSSATIAVTILVRLAGATSWFSSWPYRMAPESSSITRDICALTCGGATSWASWGGGTVGVGVTVGAGVGGSVGGATWSASPCAASATAALGGALLAGAAACAVEAVPSPGRFGAVRSAGAHAATSTSASAAGTTQARRDDDSSDRATLTVATTPHEMPAHQPATRATPRAPARRDYSAGPVARPKET